MQPKPSQSERTLPRGALGRAVEALRQGGLVIMPTETLYGVAVNAANPAAVARLRDTIVAQVGLPHAVPSCTWHAPSGAIVIETLGLRSPIARRVFDRLLPGPIRVTLSVPRPASTNALARLNVAEGVIETGDTWSVRVPSDPDAASILNAADFPVVIERIATLGPAFGDGVRLPVHIRELAASLGIDAVVDSGPTIYGRPSSQITLDTHSYRTVRTDAVSEDYIKRTMSSSIVFVCTGNTCRSPMAEMIARDLLAAEGLGPATVSSAGVAASDGAPMTGEAREALASLGIEAARHKSKLVDEAMVRGAERVFVMTKAHLRTLQALISPELSKNVQLLDPAGVDIADPIGGPIEEYRQTAQLLRAAIRARLIEMNLIDK